MHKDALEQEITVGAYIAYASFDIEIRSAQLKIGRVEAISPDGHLKVRRMDEKSARAGTILAKHTSRCILIDDPNKIPEYMFRDK
jgi:hypothetical protein